ncbi:hypothetical protein [Mycoplasmopsis felifaucium]|uniref:hypothetical protein n=1 Tax=Mycoplasmopsis felifaucium TaxID=35768 RepID=UPI0012ECB950|nr:hypothetical protein [Mycoplasmopsis felifaucium]
MLNYCTNKNIKINERFYNYWTNCFIWSSILIFAFALIPNVFAIMYFTIKKSIDYTFIDLALLTTWIIPLCIATYFWIVYPKIHKINKVYNSNNNLILLDDILRNSPKSEVQLKFDKWRKIKIKKNKCIYLSPSNKPGYNTQKYIYLNFIIPYGECSYKINNENVVLDFSNLTYEFNKVNWATKEDFFTL